MQRHPMGYVLHPPGALSCRAASALGMPQGQPYGLLGQYCIADACLIASCTDATHAARAGALYCGGSGSRGGSSFSGQLQLQASGVGLQEQPEHRLTAGAAIKVFPESRVQSMPSWRCSLPAQILLLQCGCAPSHCRAKHAAVPLSSPAPTAPHCSPAAPSWAACHATCCPPHCLALSCLCSAQAGPQFASDWSGGAMEAMPPLLSCGRDVLMGPLPVGRLLLQRLRRS